MPGQSEPPATATAALANTDPDTEQRILAAARRVFVRRGTAGARMQEIAEEAGVNQALLHYYFRSKARLADTVFEELAGRLVPALLGILSADEPLARKIESLVHLYIDNIRQTPFVPAYVVAEAHQHPERIEAIFDRSGTTPVERRRALALFGAQLEEASTLGVIRPTDPLQLLTSLIGLVVAPFLTRPVMKAAIGMTDDGFSRFLDERRRELPSFILRGLSP